MGKKVIVIVSLVLLVLVAFELTSNPKVNNDNIISDLIFLGETSEGIQEFSYSVENAGKNNVRLLFPTYLEYNFSFAAADGRDLSDVRIEHEHSSLDEIANANGRTVILKPQEKLEYQILLRNVSPGDYVISIGSAAGTGLAVRDHITEPIYNKRFTVD